MNLQQKKRLLKTKSFPFYDVVVKRDYVKYCAEKLIEFLLIKYHFIVVIRKWNNSKRFLKL